MRNRKEHFYAFPWRKRAAPNINFSVVRNLIFTILTSLEKKNRLHKVALKFKNILISSKTIVRHFRWNETWNKCEESGKNGSKSTTPTRLVPRNLNLHISPRVFPLPRLKLWCNYAVVLLHFLSTAGNGMQTSLVVGQLILDKSSSSLLLKRYRKSMSTTLCGLILSPNSGIGYTSLILA